MAKLYKLLDDKKRSGGVPSEKLLSAIKIVEERIAKASVQSVVKVSLDEKVVVREKVAKLLESKAKELSDYINSNIKNLELINYSRILFTVKRFFKKIYPTPLQQSLSAPTLSCRQDALPAASRPWSPG